MSDAQRDILTQLRQAMDSWAGEINETRSLMLSNSHSDAISSAPIFEGNRDEHESDSPAHTEVPDPQEALRDAQQALAKRDEVIASSKTRITQLQGLMGALREELSGLRAAVREGRSEQERLEAERRKTREALERLLRHHRALEASAAARSEPGADHIRLAQELGFAREQLIVLNGRIQAAQDDLASYASRYEETARSLGRSRLTQERLFRQLEERNSAQTLLRRDRDRLEHDLRELQDRKSVV